MCVFIKIGRLDMLITFFLTPIHPHDTQLCPPGFEGNTTTEDLKDTCPSARTGNAESNPDMSVCAPCPLQTDPPPRGSYRKGCEWACDGGFEVVAGGTCNATDG